jgi:hypothetical protein
MHIDLDHENIINLLYGIYIKVLTPKESSKPKQDKLQPEETNYRNKHYVRYQLGGQIIMQHITKRKKTWLAANGAVTDILSGMISSPRILSQDNNSKTETSPTTPYVPMKIGSTSMTSPTTHRGFVITWGKSFPSPSTCINTINE